MTTLRAPSSEIWTCPAEPDKEPDPRFIPITAYGEATQFDLAEIQPITAEHLRTAGYITSLQLQLATLRDDQRRNWIYHEEYQDQRRRVLAMIDQLRKQGAQPMA